MTKRLDQILIIDVEATCWQGKKPLNQDNEIIEIGVCVLDVASGERVGRESMLVKPEHSTVSDFCTQLTTLTQEQVDRGISFEAACKKLQSEYSSKSRPWASYGAYDRNQFEKQCQAWQVVYPFGRTHINVKNLLALIYHLPREVGMAQALDMLNLPLRGTHHRGDDDAWNIAAILAKLLSASRMGLGLKA